MVLIYQHNSHKRQTSTGAPYLYSAMACLVSLSILLFICLVCSQGHALSLNYYEKTCPNFESIITEVVKEATKKDKTVPAALLRMHFHDCFIRV